MHLCNVVFSFLSSSSVSNDGINDGLNDGINDGIKQYKSNIFSLFSLETVLAVTMKKAELTMWGSQPSTSLVNSEI